MKLRENPIHIFVKLEFKFERVYKSTKPSLSSSWQIDGETVDTVADFILGVSKITADGDCSNKLKDAFSLEGKL